MKTSRLVPLLLALVALAGCSVATSPDHVDPPQTPIAKTSTPTAAVSVPLITQEQVDKLSKPAIVGYVKARSQILRDGGRGAQRLRPWATSAQLREDRMIFNSYRLYRAHLTGRVRTSQFTIESFTQSAGESPRVTVTACEDYTHLRQVDRWGSIGRAFKGRDNNRMMYILTTSATNPSRLVVADIPYLKPNDCS